MAIKFTAEESVPREPVENEFREVVAYLAADFSRIQSYVIAGKTEEESLKQLAVDKRKMAEAGNALATPVTIRVPRAETLDDKKSVKVWITATTKIKREKSKSK